MRFLQEAKQMFNKKELTFLESHQEEEGIYSFHFKKPEHLNWNAGQHGFFTITHKKINKPMRPFSISSAPSEGVVRITAGIGSQPSEFKRALLELKQGMTISMRGPVGPMYIAKPHPVYLIAGGIGITPFRAILKDLEQRDYTEKIVLNYLDSKGIFLYRSELEELSRKKNLKVNYLHKRDDLYDRIDRHISQDKKEARYYLAGSKSMVDDLSKYLKNKKIDRKQIKKDPFIGYK